MNVNFIDLFYPNPNPNPNPTCMFVFTAASMCFLIILPSLLAWAVLFNCRIDDTNQGVIKTERVGEWVSEYIV